MKHLFPSLLFIGLITFGCQSDTTQTAEQPTVEPVSIANNSIALTYDKQQTVIDRPFETIDIPFQEFNYNSETGSVYQLPSGTHIEIPKNAFETSDGTPAERNVIVRYRELHSISDIMLSGIKMTYNGGDFESAGMFEIRALNANEEPLQLKADKSIAVDLASYVEGDFDHFQMNESEAEWELMGPGPVKPNKGKQKRIEALDEQEESIEVVCTDEPETTQNGDLIFDLDYDINEYTELEPFHGALWKIAGDPKQKKTFLSDRDTYERFEIAPLDSCNLFSLKLWHPTKKINELPKEKNYTITPVWQGKELEHAKKDFKTKMAEFRKKIKELNEERNIARREADLLRSFKLKGMGIYNCDRLLDYLKMVPVAVVLTCKEKIANWWYITQNKRIAIKYYNPTADNFKLNVNGSNSIIAILPDNKIGMASEAEFHRAYTTYLNDPSPDKVMQIEVSVTPPTPNPVENQQEFEANITYL